ncbi:MAG TPA: hypothetical protein VNE58_11215 [Casimicrobiaceae bacterium]|nr:hypothetical protein [Casimicrobiaceae bacterium]
MLAIPALVAGCATTPGEDDFGSMTARAVRAHVERDRALLHAVRDRVRADHAAIRDVFREAFGARGTVIERTYADRATAAQRARGDVQPTPTIVTPYRDSRGRPLDVDEIESIEMDVGLAEMLTPEGALHPRAASALARMNAMARDQGGEFTVAVPRAQMHTVTAIQAIVPGAAIVAADGDDYRLIVAAPDR